MKFSEAIREGSKYPDIHGPVFDDGGAECGACAIGGALAAAGVATKAPSNTSWNFAEPVVSTWPYVLKQHEVPCECGFTTHFNVMDSVIHLFERHRWSKKAIAEWVETIERKMEAEKPKTSSEVPVEEPVKVAH